ncbi:MAG: leucine-rich repeat domain-containing protein [Ruminococcaceae bacterium]|nr:leucine-rich repeat domain-containing protein [Oscillospiraceae bacterium]
MTLKRILAALLAAMVTVGSFSACSDKTNKDTDYSENNNDYRAENENNDVNYPDKWDVLPKADVTDISQLTYEFDDDLNGIKITGYIGESAMLHIPDTIEDKPVVAASLGNFKPTHLYMPTTLVQLEADLSELTYANYPNSKLSFFDPAIDSANLKCVYIEPSVTEIGENAFRYCTGLIKVEIPDSVTTIKTGAFSHCESLPTMKIPDSVTTIEEAAFIDCTRLTTISIPDSVTELGRLAFQSCTDLTTVNIGNGVSTISEGAFAYCDSLTDVSIGNNVTIIGNLAFARCTSLTNINIANSVTTIQGMAFSGCTSVTSITIPDSVTEIYHFAFENCTSLTSVNIPDNITWVGDSTFDICENIQATYKGTTYTYDNIEDLYKAINN